MRRDKLVVRRTKAQTQLLGAILVKLSHDHDGHILLRRHLARVTREARLRGRLSDDLADCLHTNVSGVGLEAHRTGEEVLQLSDDVGDGHMRRRRVLDDEVDLLEGVRLLVRDRVPVVLEGALRHLDSLDEAVDEQRQADGQLSPGKVDQQ